MTKFSNQLDKDIYSSYMKEVRPNLHETVNGDQIDLQKIMETIESIMTQRTNSKITLNYEPLNESVFNITSNNINNMPAAFDSIVIEDTSAQWSNDKFCVEFTWSYVLNSGKIIKGDRAALLELNKYGEILKTI